VTARFIEQGVSGAAQYRKVVDEILENARRRRFDAVVIFRGDRSFRTAGKGCLFINELISIGCAFLSVEGRYRHVDTRGRADGEDGDPDGRVGAQGDPGARARRHRRRSEQVLRWPVHVSEWMESAKEALEEETRRWAFLCPVEPVAASVAAPAVGLGEDGDIDPRRIPHRLDAELRGLVAMRDGWDELVGHLGLLVSMLGLWRTMGFASFAHYCAERLGMAARTVEQRAWLERRLYALPPLRRALREGRVGYEKARLVAAHADDATVEALIERAQMCARGELDLRVPREVGALLNAAIRAAREAAAGSWLSPGECLTRIVEHFVETWEEALAERSTRQKKVLARDAGSCQVPGCSRAAVHAHHVIYRSRGGVDEESNMVTEPAGTALTSLHPPRSARSFQAPPGTTSQSGSPSAPSATGGRGGARRGRARAPPRAPRPARGPPPPVQDPCPPSRRPRCRGRRAPPPLHAPLERT
jgi:hypothetical protein